MPKGIYDRVPKDPVPRFMAKVAKQPDGCWYWTANRYPNGYGQFYYEGRPTIAHRVSYMLFRGPISETIDHLCRVRHCVNPEHLEDVSMRENLLRGEGFSAVHAAKTHCEYGHEFTKENTRIRTSKKGRPWRVCRTCARRYVIEWAKRQ